MHHVLDTTVDGLRCIQLESVSLSLSILPEVGAKILRLFDRKQRRNVLWENPRIRPQRFPIDANFDNYWCGGWDDAFPTADACVHGGEQFPNLGELRSLAWAVEELKAGEETAAISLSAFGPISAIKATKRIRLVGQQVRLDFAIEGLGPLAADFLWGTHPSFAVQAGTCLIIPAHTGIVGSASHPSLGSPGLCYEWPNVKGHHGTTDMSLVQEISAGVACGHYLTDLEDGWFAVETNRNGVLFEFPVERCPCLWLWLVYGG